MDKHLLTDIDTDLRMAWCSVCQNLVKIKTDGIRKRDGQQYWRCLNKHRETRHSASRPWRAYKGPVCEECGFVPRHSCQLAVDHIDGDKANNTPENYQTLCHNCHAYKTHINRDYLPKSLGSTLT